MGISAYAAVTVADGTEKRAEDVVSGDSLLDASGGTALSVRKVWQGPAVGMFRIALTGGRMLDLTGDQKIMTAGGLVAADRIQPGTQIQTMDGYAVCGEAYGLPGDFMVYDIVPENPAAAPCIAANRILVGL